MPPKPGSTNPFALLRVSTTATKNDVIRKAGELLEDVEDVEVQTRYRKALEAVIHHPVERLVHTIWEMPGTDYEKYDGEWARFARGFRRSPGLEPLRATADAFAEEYLLAGRLPELLTGLPQPGPSDVGPISVPGPRPEAFAQPMTVAEVF